MKLIIAYNKHRHGGGSDVVAQTTIDLLSNQSGVKVVPFVRDSKDLRGITGNIKALVSGCYAREAVKAFSRLLDAEKPDLVHAKELYPLISPWIFKVCRKKGIPVVMTCHDYRISCPIATHFRGGTLCYECSENNELRCIWHNCCGSIGKSIAYALRNYIGRKKRLFLVCVDLFLTPSEASKEILCRYSGLSWDQVVAVGNPVPAVGCQRSENGGRRTEDEDPVDSGILDVECESADGHERREESQKNEPTDNHELLTDNTWVPGGYVAYAGRFEPEKGFDLLMEGLKDAGIPLKVAGNADAYMVSDRELPEYVEFSGHLSHEEIGRFYHEARMVIVPSICHETFGLVVAEALSCGTPVVVSDLGALAEVAGPGGLVVPAGDFVALREAILRLWNDEGLCRNMAEAGREHVKQYSDEAYVSHLLEAYNRVLG